MFFDKKCAMCGSKFMRLGCAPGNCGYIGRILGGLTMFILFGGTSKYCPNCRQALKDAKDAGQPENSKYPLDKTIKFRLIWIAVVIVILLIAGMC